MKALMCRGDVTFRNCNADHIKIIKSARLRSILRSEEVDGSRIMVIGNTSLLNEV